MDDMKNPVSRAALRVLGILAVGCVLHVFTFYLSAQLTRAALTWHPAYDEITFFIFIALWPVYIILIGAYGVLAARVRPSTLWAFAAVLGLCHGAGFTSMVYFDNQPSGKAYQVMPDDVVMTMNAACADRPLPEDPELRRLIVADRGLSPSLSVVRGDRAVAYDFDRDSKAELIVPVRCDLEGTCFWLVVATDPTRQLGSLFGALLLIMRSEGPWPDVVGYATEPARLVPYRRVSFGQAHGYGYSQAGTLELSEADVTRFLTAVPNPQCGLERGPENE